MVKQIEFKLFHGEAIKEHLMSLAKLRIKVFREFPYLYEGSLEYEEKYLNVYVHSEKSVLVAIFDQNKLVGAATAIPLSDENDYIQEPFLKNRYDLNRYYYFGEIVLLPEYRGVGLGHKLFDRVEEVATNLGFPQLCFCCVERPSDHPDRPQDYSSLDGFWRKHGCREFDGIVSEFSWPDIGEAHESKKKMLYWQKDLASK